MLVDPSPPRHPLLHGLCIRLASEEDEASLLELTNDPTVRSVSFSHRQVTWTEHHEWLQARLDSPGTLIWVAVSGTDLLGQVRYDRDDSVAIISLSVAPNARRMGIASVLLISTWGAAMSELGVRRARALTMVENEAAGRAFIKAGYQEMQRGRVSGRECRVFERAYPKPHQT